MMMRAAMMAGERCFSLIFIEVPLAAPGARKKERRRTQLSNITFFALGLLPICHTPPFTNRPG